MVGDLTNKVASHGRLNVGRAMRHPILSVNAPPFVTVHPRSQTIGQGDSLAFCVTATGTNLSFQWQHEGTNLVGDARFQGADQDILVLTSAQLPDQGSYAVVLSNGFGMTTSLVATLTVVVCPVILAQPQSRQSLDSSNLCLSVAAAGALPMAYQWRKNGTNLADGGLIGGTATASLWLTNVTPRDSGEYQVVISNACNVLTSEPPATLTVLGRPWIVAQPRSQTVVQGADVSLRVEITNTATLPLGVAWRQGQTVRGWTFLTNGFVAVTNFPHIQPATAGLWSVVATNGATLPPAGSSIRGSNAYVTVVNAPTNKAACAGDTVVLNARAAGTNLTYRWQCNGTNLVNGTKYSGVTSTNLTLVNAQPTDEGVYTFWVTNAAGMPTGFSTIPGARLLTMQWVPCAGAPGSWVSGTLLARPVATAVDRSPADALELAGLARTDLCRPLRPMRGNPRRSGPGQPVLPASQPPIGGRVCPTSESRVPNTGFRVTDHGLRVHGGSAQRLLTGRVFMESCLSVETECFVPMNLAGTGHVGQASCLSSAKPR